MAPPSATQSKAAQAGFARLGAERAADHLARGGLLVVPTETVWGLASGLDYAGKLIGLKGRDPSRALALAFQSASAVKDSGLVLWDARADKLSGRFWPGPLTLILPLAQGAPLAPELVGREGGVGLRVPHSVDTQGLLRAYGSPLVLTSANRSGENPPAGEFPDSLFPEVPRLETSARPGPLPSTVLSLLGPEPRILRKGLITGDQISGCLAS